MTRDEELVRAALEKAAKACEDKADTVGTRHVNQSNDDRIVYHEKRVSLRRMATELLNIDPAAIVREFVEARGEVVARRCDGD